MSNFAAPSSATYACATAMAAGAGLCFAGLGALYKFADIRKVPLETIILVLCIIGAAFNACLSFPAQAAAPRVVWIAGILGGLGQYGTVKLLGKGLKIGSLSAVWCAVALAFVPVFPYASLVLGQAMGLWQYLSLALAVGCVVLASFSCRQGRGDLTPGSTASGHLLFLLVLAAILLGNSVNNVAINHLTQPQGPQHANYWKMYDNLWMFTMYATMGGSLLVDLLCRGQLRGPLGWPVALGTCAATCSVVGIYLVGVASEMASAASFAVTGAANIFFSGMVSVLIFKERAGAVWVATILLGLLAVLTGNLHLT